MPGLSITNWIGFVADIIGIVGAIFAVGAWWQARQIKNELDVEKKRQQKTIRIVLSHGDEKIELPVPLLRAELTRQEVLGRIGMIPMKKQNVRYSIRYINTVEFWEQLTQVMEGAGEGIITIPLKEGELDQFDLKGSHVSGFEVELTGVLAKQKLVKLYGSKQILFTGS